MPCLNKSFRSHVISNCILWIFFYYSNKKAENNQMEKSVICIYYYSKQFFFYCQKMINEMFYESSFFFLQPLKKNSSRGELNKILSLFLVVIPKCTFQRFFLVNWSSKANREKSKVETIFFPFSHIFFIIIIVVIARGGKENDCCVWNLLPSFTLLIAHLLQKNDSMKFLLSDEILYYQINFFWVVKTPCKSALTNFIRVRKKTTPLLTCF